VRESQRHLSEGEWVRRAIFNATLAAAEFENSRDRDPNFIISKS